MKRVVILSRATTETDRRATAHTSRSTFNQDYKSTNLAPEADRKGDSQRVVWRVLGQADAGVYPQQDLLGQDQGGTQIESGFKPVATVDRRSTDL